MKQALPLTIRFFLVLGLLGVLAGVWFSLAASPAQATSTAGTSITTGETSDKTLFSPVTGSQEFRANAVDENDPPDEERSVLDTSFRLISVLVLVGLNAFFVAAEFSLVSVRRTRVEELIAQGNRAAVVVGRAVADPDRFIAATQLGITLASLGLGWIGEPALAGLLVPLLRFLPQAWIGAAAHSIAGTIAFALITFMHVVGGELAPKSIALQDPESTALAVARPTEWTLHLFRPAIWALNGAGNALLRLFGIQPASGHERVHSVAELRMLVEASHEGGVLAADEREMLHAVFDFSQLAARQLMVPRTEMICLPATATLDQVAQAAAEHALTKFPVYEGDLDHILGIVHIKDTVRTMHAQAQETTTVRGIMRPALFVPESIRVDDLLVEFRRKRQHIAILLDEYGGTAGLVTLEDLLEEIVGDVQDAFDQEEPEVQWLPDGSALLSGLMQIEQVNAEFGLNLSAPHYDTLAGYVLNRLRRLAKVGDEVEGDGIRLRVEALDGRRIARLSLFLKEHEKAQKVDDL